MDCCVYVGEELAKYGFGHGHPFGQDRMDAFWTEARVRGLDKKLEVLSPESAPREAIERFHTKEYVARVQELSKLGSGVLDQGDTPAFPGVFEAASTVAGTTLAAVERLMSGESKRAFVPIAGLHHARRDTAAGFCVFNDCGVAIEALRAVHSIRRVAYVDIDAHHGDGVFYAFEGDLDLAFADIHEDGRFLYPGTGRADETGSGKARGTKLNIPLPPESGDPEFLAAWKKVEAFIDEAAPEFILLQCGADSLAGDPITHLRYSAAAHAHAACRLRGLADRHSSGRLLAMGGGGYSRPNLAAAWCAVLEAFLA